MTALGVETLVGSLLLVGGGISFVVGLVLLTFRGDQ